MDHHAAGYQNHASYAARTPRLIRSSPFGGGRASVDGNRRPLQDRAYAMPEPTLLRPDPLPVERILFDGPLVRVGSFRCPTTNPLFADSGPIVNPIFVFPRTGVWIEHEGGEPFVADPSIATLYNRGQIYRRRPLSRSGDACDWFAIAPAVLAEIAGARDSRVTERPERPFAASHTPIDSRTYLCQRGLVDRLERDAPDALFVEEQAIRLASCVTAPLANAVRLSTAGQGSSPVSRVQREQGEHAREILAARFCERLTLADIAGLVGISAFHLCRVFRRHTGLALHEYRTKLRLRHALERLEDARPDLTRIALDIGFSSHSHFTDSFRREFSVTPSAFVRTRRNGERPPAAQQESDSAGHDRCREIIDIPWIRTSTGS